MSLEEPKLFVCTKCGEAKAKDQFSNEKRGKYGIKHTCKKCICKLANDYYKNNTKRCIKSSRNWAKNNPEKVKKTIKKWRENNLGKGRECLRKGRELVRPYYAKKILIQNGFKKEDITPELIEVQRLIIKTKRLCKTSQTSEQV